MIGQQGKKSFQSFRVRHLSVHDNIHTFSQCLSQSKLSEKYPGLWGLSFHRSSFHSYVRCAADVFLSHNVKTVPRSDFAYCAAELLVKQIGISLHLQTQPAPGSQIVSVISL